MTQIMSNIDPSKASECHDTHKSNRINYFLCYLLYFFYFYLLLKYFWTSVLFFFPQPEEKMKFDSIFDSLGPVGGILTGDKVKPVLLNSKLPVDILGRVWSANF